MKDAFSLLNSEGKTVVMKDIKFLIGPANEIMKGCRKMLKILTYQEILLIVRLAKAGKEESKSIYFFKGFIEQFPEKRMFFKTDISDEFAFVNVKQKSASLDIISSEQSVAHALSLFKD